jgi:hypothetical protein
MTSTSAVEPSVLQELEAELEDITRLERPSTAAMEEALLMEHLANLAAGTDDEGEAEAFLGAVVPLVSKLIPQVAKAVPALAKGVASVGRQIWQDPETRRFVRTVPSMVRRTAADIATQYGAGRDIGVQDVTRSLARQVGQVLREPDQRAAAMRRNRELDRQYHRLVRTKGAGQPQQGAVGGRCPCCGQRVGGQATQTGTLGDERG